MSVWLKVCGLTDQRAVDAALDAGVQAIGFVFATSPRRIEPDHARALKEHIDGRAEVIAVMRHPKQTLVDDVLRVVAPDVLQTDYEDLQALRIPKTQRTLSVLRGTGRPVPMPARVLFEGAASGAGELSDWEQARGLAADTELILAGGLSPDNVAAAIARVQPFGVDVSSGVESQRGVKDVEKIYAFAQAVRSAAAQD
ncbi:MAG: phosphoribosylanthranilate isomerase [Gammaproteobacteria bacterium]